MALASKMYRTCEPAGIATVTRKQSPPAPHQNEEHIKYFKWPPPSKRMVECVFWGHTKDQVFHHLKGLASPDRTGPNRPGHQIRPRRGQEKHSGHHELSQDRASGFSDLELDGVGGLEFLESEFLGSDEVRTLEMFRTKVQMEAARFSRQFPTTLPRSPPDSRCPKPNVHFGEGVCVRVA